MTLMDDIGMMNNYDERKVAQDVLENGLEVSTAYTTDEGYETAIINTLGKVSPVERYYSKDDAVLGHAVWLAFAADGIGKTITVLVCYQDNWKSIEEKLE